MNKFKLDFKNMTLAEIDNEVIRLSETAEYLKKINKTKMKKK
jgi:predicted membrane-bound spermidine synthase